MYIVGAQHMSIFVNSNCGCSLFMQSAGLIWIATFILINRDHQHWEQIEPSSSPGVAKFKACAWSETFFAFFHDKSNLMKPEGLGVQSEFQHILAVSVSP